MRDANALLRRLQVLNRVNLALAIVMALALVGGCCDMGGGGHGHVAPDSTGVDSTDCGPPGPPCPDIPPGQAKKDTS